MTIMMSSRTGSNIDASALRGGRKPKFTDLAEMNRFVALVMGLFNDIVFCFEQAPQEFPPTFYESKVKGRRIIIVDEWCWGFLKGLRLDPKKAGSP
jgi:uncharacterized protein